VFENEYGEIQEIHGKKVKLGLSEIVIEWRLRIRT
jgi:hypothetical protein